MIELKHYYYIAQLFFYHSQGQHYKVALAYNLFPA